MGAVAAALILIVAGMALVRVGWDGPTKAAGAGWAAALCGLLWLTVRDGAWGLAVGTVAAMAAALGIVLYAAIPFIGHQATGTKAIAWLAAFYGVTMLIFSMYGGGFATIPAYLADLFGTKNLQALARRGGARAADATALTLMLQPVAWGLLMTWQMTRSGPARMIAPPLAAALLGTLLWSVA